MDLNTPVEVASEPAVTQDIAEELARLGIARKTLAALQPAVSATRCMDYQAGEVLFHTGSEPATLYVILRGRIKMITHLEHGRDRIVRLHKRGSIIGLNGLLDEPHAHTAIAIDEVLAYQLPMRLIKTVTSQDAETYSQLLEQWHTYLKLADTWITDFSTGAVRGRVARLLRFLAETEEETRESEITLLTVDDMAEILGVTPESVSRVMADMKRNKLLRPVTTDSADRFFCNMRLLATEAEH